MKFYLSFFTILSLFSNAFAIGGFLKSGQAVVVIDGVQKKLTKSTSCNPKAWGWSETDSGTAQGNACQCCIAKHALKGTGTFNSTQSSLTSCQKKWCTDFALKKLEEKLGVSQADKSFVSEVIEDISVVKDVKSDMTDRVKIYLKAMAQRGVAKKISPGFKLTFEDCYNVKTLGGGGAQTLQLFLVSDCDNKPLYIIKELKKKITETSNIEKIRKTPLLSKYIYPNHEEGYPSISLTLKFFTYYDDNQKAHTLAALPVAPGEQLIKILQSFSSNYASNNQEENVTDDIIRKRTEYIRQRITLPKVMYDFGRQLGRFHLLGMEYDRNGVPSGYSRTVHGDMHSNNIFIDQNNNNAMTFIDAETMALALKKPRYVGADLRKFYIFAAINKRVHQYAKGNIPAKEWHDIVIKPFFTGYITSYAMHNKIYTDAYRKAAFDIISYSLLKTFGTKEKLIDTLLVPTAYGHSPLKLWNYMRKYLSPLIKELQNELIDENGIKNSIHAIGEE